MPRKPLNPIYLKFRQAYCFSIGNTYMYENYLPVTPQSP